MQPVKVPKEVATACDYHKNMWGGMSEDSHNLTFMAIPFSAVSGHALILRNYAKEHPTDYARALANGYEPEINVQDELAQMITMWLNKEYVGDEKKDIQNFAKMVTKYLQQQNRTD